LILVPTQKVLTNGSYRYQSLNYQALRQTVQTHRWEGNAHANQSKWFKYWRLQYRFEGKQSGDYPIVSLGEARRKRDVAKKWYLMVLTLLRRKKQDGLFTAIGKRKISELKTRDLLVPIRAVEASERLEVASRLQKKIQQ